MLSPSLLLLLSLSSLTHTRDLSHNVYIGGRFSVSKSNSSASEILSLGDAQIGGTSWVPLSGVERMYSPGEMMGGVVSDEFGSDFDFSWDVDLCDSDVPFPFVDSPFLCRDHWIHSSFHLPLFLSPFFSLFLLLSLFFGSVAEESQHHLDLV